MLRNSELRINHGSKLKLKLGDKRHEYLSRNGVLRNLTIGKPLKLNIVEVISI